MSLQAQIRDAQDAMQRSQPVNHTLLSAESENHAALNHEKDRQFSDLHNRWKGLDETNRVAVVRVTSDQFSLAIGRGGQNVRLAARLTGWKISVQEDRSNAASATEVSAPVEASPDAVAPMEATPAPVAEETPATPEVPEEPAPVAPPETPEEPKT